jgi:hypothetical protein
MDGDGRWHDGAPPPAWWQASDGRWYPPRPVSRTQWHESPHVVVVDDDDDDDLDDDDDDGPPPRHMSSAPPEPEPEPDELEIPRQALWSPNAPTTQMPVINGWAPDPTTARAPRPDDDRWREPLTSPTPDYDDDRWSPDPTTSQAPAPSHDGWSPAPNHDDGWGLGSPTSPGVAVEADDRWGWELAPYPGEGRGDRNRAAGSWRRRAKVMVPVAVLVLGLAAGGAAIAVANKDQPEDEAGVEAQEATTTSTTVTEAFTTSTVGPGDFEAGPPMTRASGFPTTESLPPPTEPIATDPPGALLAVTPGAYCAPAAAHGTSATGIPMTCETEKCDGTSYDQPRWRKAHC